MAKSINSAQGKLWHTLLRRRIDTVLVFITALFAVLWGRIFSLQVINYQRYAAFAAKQHIKIEEILPWRGNIFFRDNNGNYIVAARGGIKYKLIAVPKNIEDPEKTADILAEILDIDKEKIKHKLAKPGDPYEIIANYIDDVNVEKIKAIQLKGIRLEEQRRRIYPNGSLGANILGFVNLDGEEKGKYGLELFYNRQLSGKEGFSKGFKDASGFWVSLGRRILRPPQNGFDLFLSVDYNIQSESERVLKEAIEKWNAKSGLVLVVDPNTGGLLALAVSPSFDPNKFFEVADYSRFINPAVQSQYELGSVMKPFVMAAAINEGLVDPHSTYEDKGKVVLGEYTIHNFDGKAYGVQTMTQVLEKSLNTGSIYVASLLGKEKHLKYLKMFGFGAPTGIDLPGEVAGDISRLYTGGQVEFATASYGHGIAVTPMQIVMAMSAIANGGKLMTPYVVEEIRSPAGEVVFRFKPNVLRRVISKKTSEMLTKMLVSVVSNGFAKAAGVRGYFVAGKTGTAQIAREDGKGYYKDRVIHSFIGYAPAFSPKFLIYIQLNEPKGNMFSANTLSLPFHNLASYILNYYQIPPDQM